MKITKSKMNPLCVVMVPVHLIIAGLDHLHLYIKNTIFIIRSHCIWIYV